jgi:hypothetical protein
MWRDAELNVRPLTNLQGVWQVLVELGQFPFQFENYLRIYVASWALIYRVVALINYLNSAD